MKKMRTIKRLTAIAMMMVMLCSTTVFAADNSSRMTEEIESGHFPISGYGIDYEMWSIMYKDSSNSWRGASYVHTIDNSTVPAGYMGVSTGLYRPNGGEKYVELEMNYNGYPATIHWRFTGNEAAESVGIIAKGRISVYNGAGYTTKDAPATEIRYPSKFASSEVSSSVMDNLMLTLDENGQYPVTAAGKTYGSELLAERVGFKPDLIYAEGIDGTLGYIKAEDLEPDVSNPEEALAYMEEQKNNVDGFYTIPLYDLNENVIGAFKVLVGGSEKIPAEILATIERILQMDENARMTKMLGTDKYERNSKGEAFGSSLLASVVGCEPDLSAAIGTEGQDGYIRESDTIWGKWKDSIQTPQDALRYMEYLKTQPDEYLIPLYDSEGNVIGSFRYGGYSEPSEEEIARFSR